MNNVSHNLTKPLLGGVLLVKQKILKKGDRLMEDVPIVVNAVVKYGQKVCKGVKRNIVNKGTATSLLIVRVSGISANVPRLGEVFRSGAKPSFGLRPKQNRHKNNNKFINQVENHRKEIVITSAF